jgi:hypothetical protein
MIKSRARWVSDDRRAYHTRAASGSLALTMRVLSCRLQGQGIAGPLSPAHLERLVDGRAAPLEC